MAWLDAGMVPPYRREAWIDHEVLARDVEVLLVLVDPNAVRTGLNNLVAFSTAIWYRLHPSATTYPPPSMWTAWTCKQPWEPPARFDG